LAHHVLLLPNFSNHVFQNSNRTELYLRAEDSVWRRQLPLVPHYPTFQVQV
jgi:hypothetical protein